jgi:hypothetical protein
MSLSVRTAKRVYMQNASTAAATAIDARVTEDVGSQVILLLSVPIPGVVHFPAS